MKLIIFNNILTGKDINKIVIIIDCFHWKWKFLIIPPLNDLQTEVDHLRMLEIDQFNGGDTNITQ